MAVAGMPPPFRGLAQGKPFRIVLRLIRAVRLLAATATTGENWPYSNNEKGPNMDLETETRTIPGRHRLRRDPRKTWSYRVGQRFIAIMARLGLAHRMEVEKS